MTSEPRTERAADAPISRPSDEHSGGPGASAPRRLHPAAFAIAALRRTGSVGVGLIALLASLGPLYGAIVVLVLLAILAVFAYIEWSSTTYTVEDGALRYRSGVFSRKDRNIPATRISALDTSRGVLQRIFGVVAVQVRTAGGGKRAEVTLGAVSFKEAERLRHELGHRATQARSQTDAAATGGDATDRRHGSTADASASNGTDQARPTGPSFTSSSNLVEDAPVVYRITPRELLAAALTNPSIAIVGAIIGGLFSRADDLLSDGTQRQVESSLEHASVAVAVGLGVLALIAAIIVSIAGTVLVFAGFTVTRDDRRLRIRHGLLTERTGTVPRDRIQGLRLVESPLRRLLGYAAVEVEVAGYAGQDEATRTLIPIVRRSALPEVLPTIVPGLALPDRELHRVPARATRRYCTFPLLAALIPTVAVLVAPIGLGRVAAIVFPVLAVGAGMLRARATGWLLEGDTLVLRWGMLGRVTLLAQSSKLQMTEQVSNPLQRRAQLGTFKVRLGSGRHGHARHLDKADVDRLVRRTGRAAMAPVATPSR